MDIGGFFLHLFVLIYGIIIGYPMNDQIKKLPGQPLASFLQFSGYINVDGDTGKNLFYYFVEAENDPMNKPLTIWLTGGKLDENFIYFQFLFFLFKNIHEHILRHIPTVKS